MLNDNIRDLMQIIQTVGSVIACILAFWIPKKIKWEQLYSQLLSDYCGYDIGAAIIGIVHFFHLNCSNDINKIQPAYNELYKQQFDLSVNTNNHFKVSNEQNIHLQRRLLVQFYCQLDLCARSPFIGKKRVQKDFTSKEANLLKILYYMNEAASEEPIFMDITTADRVRKDMTGINLYIAHMYYLLRDSPGYIRQ